MAESGLAPSPVATPYSPNAAVCREIQDRIRGARRLTRAAGMVEAFSDPAEAALAAALRRLELLPPAATAHFTRSEEHTSELQSQMRISYAVFCLKTKNPTTS